MEGAPFENPRYIRLVLSRRRRSVRCPKGPQGVINHKASNARQDVRAR
jgi:hypothetical protein